MTSAKKANAFYVTAYLSTLTCIIVGYLNTSMKLQPTTLHAELYTAWASPPWLFYKCCGHSNCWSQQRIVFGLWQTRDMSNDIAEHVRNSSKCCSTYIQNRVIHFIQGSGMFWWCHNYIRCWNCNMAYVRNTFNSMQQLLFTYFQHLKNSSNKTYSRSDLKNW